MVSYRQIKKYQYISFDVFDTLIKRSVAMPTDLFLLVERWCENTAKDIPPGFAQKRREAELHANAKMGAPARLDDIYNELKVYYGASVDELKEIELRFELSGCQPNLPCVELFNRCIEDGKTVVLISDMYLPATFIEEMLGKCNIHGYKKLFVSCEIGARKKDGSLYRTVMHELQIHPRQLYHIGDNLRVDFLVPISLGMRAAHINYGLEKFCKNPKGLTEEDAFSYRTMQACMQNCSVKMSEHEKMGCRVFGPQLYGFTQWLLKRLRDNSIHDVYFMAREGYTMKLAFDALGIEDIRSQYLYCSRRSYQVPMIWRNSQFDNVIIPFCHKREMTCRKFLLSIGLPADAYIGKAASYGVQMDRLYEKGSFYKDEAIRMFYDSIRVDVEKNSKEEYDALVAYLRSLDMQEQIAVVDIGYNGSMQFALKELIDIEGWNIKVKGFYAGTRSESPFIREKKITAEGYWYDAWKCEESKILKDAIGLTGVLPEVEYLKTQGSVSRFIIENGISKPVFLPYENDQNKTKNSNGIEFIESYQSGAIRFVRYMLDVIPLEAIHISSVSAIYDFLRMGISPTLKEAVLWGNLQFLNYDMFYIAKPKGCFYYLTHWKIFKKDFLTCFWRIGFMKRLFKIPLPYKEMYLGLKRIYNC